MIRLIPFASRPSLRFLSLHQSLAHCLHTQSSLFAWASCGLPITRALQSIRTSQPTFRAREKKSRGPPCLTQKLNNSSRAKDWLILNDTFTTSSGARSLMERDMSCNQMRQLSYIHTNARFRVKLPRIPPVNTVLWSTQKLVRKW